MERMEKASFPRVGAPKILSCPQPKPSIPERRLEPRNYFAETSLSLLHCAREGDDDAMNELCSRYWQPLRTWALVRGLARSDPDADDLLQDFFAKMLRKGSLAQHDPDRGARFRDYLWKCLKNHAIDQWRKPTLPLKESPDSTYTDWLGSQNPVAPEGLKGDKPWAERMLAIARDRLRHEWARGDQQQAFEALAPMLEGDRGPEGLQAVASRLGISHENARVRIHRMRKRLRQLIEIQVLADLPPDATEEERAEEMQRFREILRS
jgi:RNA polymerase sigma factor (sigma-70 family)